jgi:hypothetical protein
MKDPPFQVSWRDDKQIFLNHSTHNGSTYALKSQ